MTEQQLKQAMQSEWVSIAPEVDTTLEFKTKRETRK
jgi:hypothetical protein